MFKTWMRRIMQFLGISITEQTKNPKKIRTFDIDKIAKAKREANKALRRDN